MASLTSQLKVSKQSMLYQQQLNRELANEDRAWQEKMSNSAHQREIADLKKAGLNPVLSVTGGNGATTPTGSSSSVSDGSGYLSALTNLEAARINSATQLQLAANQHGYNMTEIIAKGEEDRKTKGVTDGSTWFGQISNSPKMLDNLITNLNTKIALSNPKTTQAVKDIYDIYNSYAQYVSSYEKLKKNGHKFSKSETKKYNQYKKYLKRNNMYAKKYSKVIK